MFTIKMASIVATVFLTVEFGAVQGPTLPPTCPAAITSYSSLADVPQPFRRLTLPRDTTRKEVGEMNDVVDAVARVGATGYSIERIAEKDLTDNDKKLMAQYGLTEAFQTVAVFVPADSARVHEICKKYIKS